MFIQAIKIALERWKTEGKFKFRGLRASFPALKRETTPIAIFSSGLVV